MKKAVLLYLVIALVCTGCASASLQANSKAANANAQSSKTNFFMVGKVEAAEKADITSKIPAKISEINVDVGSAVKKGDSIIRLDTKDMEAQVAQAQAGVSTAEANLAKAQSGTRPEQLAQIKAKIESDTTNYNNAKNTYDRSKQLFEDGVIPKSQFESAQTILASAEAQYNSDKEQMNILSRGETQETLNVLQSQLKQSQAALDTAKTLLTNSIITSPVSGIVSAKNINVGELATVGAALVSIVNPEAIYVNAYLPAYLVGKIKAGQDVVIKVSEVPEKEYQGIVSVIDPVVDQRSKTILVKVKFKDADTILKPGMFAEVGLKN